MELFERNPLEEAIEQLHDATAYYTAEPVVDQLLSMMNWPNGDRRLADPGCGDGAILGAALELLLESEPDADDSRITHLVSGIEIHWLAALEARRRLSGILVRHGRAKARADAMTELMVTCDDFLLRGPGKATWDCVVANPPFLRYSRLPEVLRFAYEEALPDYSQGDMLHSFIDKCMAALRPGGEVGMIASDRFLFTENASELRAVIGQRMGLQHVERLDCSSAFYRPKNRRAGQPPRIHPVAVVFREAQRSRFPLTRDPIYPEACDKAYEGLPKLGDLAKVRLAPWLGKHGLFVVDLATAALADIPLSMLVPAVDTDDIKGGVLRTPTKYAIRTQRNVEPPASVTAHLEANMHLLAKSKQRTKQRWLPPESFEKLSLDRPSLLVPRIANSLRPVRVPPGILPLDHGLSIVSAGDRTLDELEDALMRPESEQWVRERAPRLENGFVSLTTRLLRRMPIR
ncbi:MAG: SAM-dependent methyltransferase [Nevskiaceae bacterium]|nr:MAG: SAM-dependent methyltransferase [Nevskiaceae bacterium]